MGGTVYHGNWQARLVAGSSVTKGRALQLGKKRLVMESERPFLPGGRFLAIIMPHFGQGKRANPLQVHCVVRGVSLSSAGCELVLEPMECVGRGWTGLEGVEAWI